MLRKTFTKPFFLLSFIIFSFSAEATTYYVSNSGNDNNSGTSASSPWQTINKVNSFKKFSPGDDILFNRGNTFYGSITVSNSGSSGNPITFGAYGSGANPIITGFTNVTSWTNLGGNIWESTNAVSTLSTCNMVAVNGVNTAMGRYPNTGYLTYQSYSGSTYITSSSLTGSPNWKGAGIVIKKRRYVLESGMVTGQSGNTISYKDPAIYTPTVNFGFFIENDPRTLDMQNEWYYNPSTKKIRVYSVGSPSNVRTASVETLVATAGNASYITFNNISFQGSNSSTFNLYSSNYISIRNCNISYSGIDGINANGTFIDIENNNISYANDNAIKLSSSCSNSSIINNTLKSIGVIPGMTQTYSYGSISALGDNTLIQYNNIDSSGYIGIVFNGNNTKVKNNFINYSCLIKDDGAGIYTAGTNTGRQIIGNIILNSIGCSEGTDVTTNILAHGIHLDGGTQFVTVSGNSVSGCRGAGFFIQQSTDLTISGNTSYDNGIKGNWLKGGLMFQYTANDPIRGLVLTKNIFFAKTLDQLALFYYSSSTNTSDIKQLGTADSNYYARPLNSSNYSITSQTGTLGSVLQNIPTWQSYSGQDFHSKGSPKSISSTDSLRFEYNASSSNKTIALDANYIDVAGKSYNGTITLAPYTSAVLIRNGAATGNQPPVANAGTDATVTLPTATTTLSGSGKSSNAGGTITGYSWTQLSGPAATIVSPSSATTSLTGLSAGTYQFQLMVTDNNGATAKATVQITVTANKAPETETLLAAVNPANTVNGLNYSYYEASSYSALPSFSSLTPVKTGSTSNFDISLANRSTSFSFNFTGYINVPADGQYTFYTTSDDGSNLYIDNVLVVNNDGLHGIQERSGTIGLKAGKHSISVDYFQEGGGSVLSVSYAGPGISKQVVPSSSFYRVSNLLAAVNPANTVNGLDYNYYEASSYSALPSFNSLAPVKKGSTSNFDISVANRSLSFSFIFYGYINVPADGQYTFYTTSDDGSNLNIDNVLVVNNDGLHGIQERSGTIGLKAGKHIISAGYFQEDGGKVLSVSYSGPGISKQVVPSSSLYRVSNSNAQRSMSSLPALTSGKDTTNMQTTLMLGNDTTNTQANQLGNPEIKPGIKVYPNPFSSSININISGVQGSKFRLILLDASGKIVWYKNIGNSMSTYQETVNTSTFATGIYFLQLIQDDKSSVIKLVKQY